MFTRLLKAILLAFVTILPAVREVAAAPTPVQGIIEQPIQDVVEQSLGGSIEDATSITPVITTRKRRRSLADDLAPILALLAPTLQGVGAGLQEGAGNVKAAVQNAGAALGAADGAADIAANTLAGAGQTVGQAPAGVAKTIHAIDHSPGIIGSVDRAVFGQ